MFRLFKIGCLVLCMIGIHISQSYSQESFEISDDLFAARNKTDCSGKVDLKFKGIISTPSGIFFKAEGSSIMGVYWCRGAKHTWIGRITYEGYTFDSDDADPLQFMVNEKGYIYVKGKGMVTMPDGKAVKLPALMNQSLQKSPQAKMLKEDVQSYRTIETRELILPRIIAEKGDGSGIKVTLRMGKTANAKIIDIGGLSYAIGSVIHSASEGKDMLIVSGNRASVFYSLKDLGKASFLVEGDFFIDTSFNPVGEREGEYSIKLERLDVFTKGGGRPDIVDDPSWAGKWWGGKQEGATHIITDKISMFDYVFTSNSDNPLIFKMSKEGYVFQSGKGTVKDLKSGDIYVLESSPKESSNMAESKAQSSPIEKQKSHIRVESGAQSVTDKKTCEEECRELFRKGQLRQGVTLEGCIKTLCK